MNIETQVTTQVSGITLTLDEEEFLGIWGLYYLQLDGNSPIRRKLERGLEEAIAQLSLVSPYAAAFKEALIASRDFHDYTSTRISRALAVAKGARA